MPELKKKVTQTNCQAVLWADSQNSSQLVSIIASTPIRGKGRVVETPAIENTNKESKLSAKTLHTTEALLVPDAEPDAPAFAAAVLCAAAAAAAFVAGASARVAGF